MASSSCVEIKNHKNCGKMKTFRFIVASLMMISLFHSCSKYEYIKDGWYGQPEFVMGEPVNEESGDKFEEFSDNPFMDASKNPVSTFSVDADGAAYGVMRRYVSEGILPNKNSVRIEEYLNYFNFDYPDPQDDNNVAINATAGPCAWNNDHMLLRLGIKGRSIQTADLPPANFVFLIDVSGSMNSQDKLYLLKTGLKNLVEHLRPTDRISIVTYSGTVKKLLESTLVSDSKLINKAISSLVASGSTAGGAALEMAYKEALANFIEGGNNRVIMGTDGDFNVGVTDTDALVEMVEDYAAKGIYMTVCGFGYGNLNDSMMEKISNSGNGTYEYIDSEDELTKVFVNERSEFFSVANDSKVQVTFDPAAVAKYRLIGYENRVLSQDDFENDQKDAGEIGAGQTITALYEIIPAEGYAPEAAMATFDFRYKKSLGAESIPLSLEVKTPAEGYEPDSEFLFASGIAAYGMILRESPYKGEATFDMASELVRSGLEFDPYGYRAQLVDLIGKAKLLAERDK